MFNICDIILRINILQLLYKCILPRAYIFSVGLGRDRLKLRPRVDRSNWRVYQLHMFSLVFSILSAFFNFNLKGINFDLKGYQFQLKVNFKQINWHKKFQFWPICDQFDIKLINFYLNMFCFTMRTKLIKWYYLLMNFKQ